MMKSSAAYLMFQTLWGVSCHVEPPKFYNSEGTFCEYVDMGWNVMERLYDRWCYLLCVCVTVNVILRGCISSSKLMHEDGSDLLLVNMSVMVDIHPCSYHH